MNVCPREFDAPDPRDPSYSMTEIDFYAATPPRLHDPMPNHRLSLRRNLVTGRYEVYRQYVNTVEARGVLAGQSFTLVTTRDGDLEEVALETADLGEALKFADEECVKRFGGGSWDDRVCDGHRLPALFTCPDPECYKAKTGAR